MRKIMVMMMLFCLSFSVFAKLSDTEKEIRSYIIQQKEAQIDLLQKLVNIHSGTTNVKGVYQVGEIVKQAFDELGFKTEWVEGPKEMQRAPTLIAMRLGHIGKKLLLIGHLDTVFSPASRFQQFVRKENIAIGPGVTDDKGGVVVILYALKALNAVNALDDRHIIVVLTGDEEDSGKPTSISRRPLREAAKKSDIALDFEGANSLQTIAISRRGISDWSITVKGNESHSSTIFGPQVGAGAIFEAARILEAMRTRLANQKQGLTFNPGMIVGGTIITYDKKESEATVLGKSNVVSKTALMRGDYRYTSATQRKWFEEQLTAIVKQHLPYTKSTVQFEEGIPAMPQTENNEKLLKKLSKVSLDLGMGEITPDLSMRGAGDISHIAAIVSAGLIGMGPTGHGEHSVIESIELNSLPIQTERAAIFIYRLTR